MVMAVLPYRIAVHDLLVEMGRRLSVEILVSNEDPIEQVHFDFLFIFRQLCLGASIHNDLQFEGLML